MIERLAPWGKAWAEPRGFEREETSASAVIGTVTGAVIESLDFEREETSARAATESRDTAKESRGIPPAQPKPAEAPPATRFFNAGFFAKDSDEPIPTDQPLSLDRAWRLGVNIGAPWGPGQLDDGKFDEILAGAFAAKETIELVVAVRSRSVGVEPQMQTLTIARRGDSAVVFFDLTFGRAARHALNIDLFYMGHLIKSRRIEVEVVKKVGITPPAGRKPQDSWLLFSRAEVLTPQQMAPLVKHPRRLTITVQHEDNETRLCFYDLMNGLIGEQPLPIADASLTTLLNRTRAVLQTVVGYYGNRVGGDLEELRLNLWQLASAGFELYRVLLKGVYDPDSAGPGEKPIMLNLEPGQTIQVAPLSNLAGVPWELLYDQKIERYRKEQPNRVQLCPDFMTHAPDACPNAEDPKIVCPYGFWGFRYVIEQLPNRVPLGQASKVQLPLQVRNMLPLRLAALVYGFKELEEHLKALTGLSDQVQLARVDTLDLVESTLKQSDRLPDILYFYAHGGFDKDAPSLTLGSVSSRFEVTVGDLEGWTFDLSAQQPLVIINACESAAYRPDRVESLLEKLMEHGASGIVGTQVQVTTHARRGLHPALLPRVPGRRCRRRCAVRRAARAAEAA